MSNANERLARLEAKEELWSEYNQVGGRFGMHPNFHYLKGIEASTGSLGHGLSLSVGYALSARMDKRDYWVVCMTGDGEMDEGSNWEALMTGAQYGLGNLVLIVDKNQFQIGNGIDHGLHRPIGHQDGLWCQLVKRQDFLNLFSLGIENVRECSLLQGDGSHEIGNRLTAGYRGLRRGRRCARC